MHPTRSFFVVLAALCLASIAMADPAKPNPPTTYSLSAFSITPNGLVSARVFYDQPNLRARTDLLDGNFNQVGEFIGLWNANKGYWYESASGNCQTFPLNQAWANTWDFLNTATFGGVDEYYSGMTCDLWLNQLDDDMTMATCFSNDAPVFVSLFNGTELNSLYFITSFTPSVDPSVFSLPSTCGSSFKMSAMPMMNLKKYKVPAHPLLF